MMRRGVIEAASATVTGRSLLSAHLNFKLNSQRRLMSAAFHGSTMLRQQFGLGPLHPSAAFMAPVAASFMNYQHLQESYNSQASIVAGGHYGGLGEVGTVTPQLDDDVESALLESAVTEILALKNDQMAVRPAWRPPAPPSLEQIDNLVSAVRATCFPELFGSGTFAMSATPADTTKSTTITNKASVVDTCPEPCVTSSSSSSSSTACSSSSSVAAAADASSAPSSPSSSSSSTFAFASSSRSLASVSSVVDRALMKTQVRRALTAASAIVQPSLVLDALDGGVTASNDPDVDPDLHRPALAAAVRRQSQEAVLASAEQHWNDVVKLRFTKLLPAIVQDINADVDFTLKQDVATNSRIEVILAYPGVRAMLYHRVAHALLRSGAPLMLARLISERGHSLTGIDIHPGATIGGGCFIDHGTGLVIGGTAEIGKNVCLFHGVTLGAKGFPVDAQGRRIKHAKRHPILQDNVSVYAGATVLGRITIGSGASIGAGATVVKDVEPGFTVGAARAPPTMTPPKA